MSSSFPVACGGPCPWKPQRPWTLFFLPGSVACGHQSHSRGANRVETELLSVFRVSTKDFLCSQKTILSLRPAPRTVPTIAWKMPRSEQDLLSSANTIPPSQSPLRSLLDPSGSHRGRHFLIFPSPSPLPPRQSPRYKDPLTSSRPSARETRKLRFDFSTARN